MKMTNRKENQKKSEGKQTKASTDVRGSRATEVPEFIPTRYDLLELVEYWESEKLRREWDNFITGMIIPDWEAIFHSGRIARIAEVLGEEEVERVIAEVWERFSRRCDARRLDIFLHGDEEQWKAVQDEFHQEFLQQCERPERRLKEKEDLEA